jgi:acyl carrier protein
MEINQFVRNFENAIFGIEPNSLNPDTRFREIEQWESLALLCLLAMIDSEYDVQVGGMELKQCETLRDIFEIVASKKLLKVA